MKRLRWILAIVFLIAGIAGGLYVGGYLLLFKSILTACIAWDAGHLTAAIVWSTIVKVLLSMVAMSVIIFAGLLGFGITMPEEYAD